MNVILYSTNCPRCNVLEKKLSDAKVDFNVTNDIKKIIEKGFRTAPVLEVDGEFLDFKNAIEWVNKQEQ